MREVGKRLEKGKWQLWATAHILHGPFSYHEEVEANPTPERMAEFETSAVEAFKVQAQKLGVTYEA